MCGWLSAVHFFDVQRTWNPAHILCCRTSSSKMYSIARFVQFAPNFALWPCTWALCCKYQHYLLSLCVLVLGDFHDLMKIYSCYLPHFKLMFSCCCYEMILFCDSLFARISHHSHRMTRAYLYSWLTHSINAIVRREKIDRKKNRIHPPTQPHQPILSLNSWHKHN